MALRNLFVKNLDFTCNIFVYKRVVTRTLMNCFDKFVYFSKIYMHEWISVNGWYRDMRYLKVFRALMNCQRGSRVLGRHNLVSELRYTNTQGLVGMGLGHAVIVESLGYECLGLDV